MDKHKLSEILQALPDSFSFTAVLEEVIKEREKKCKVAFEESSEQTQAQILQANQGYLESKEQELWEDIRDTEMRDMGKTTHRYNFRSKEWEDDIYFTDVIKYIKEQLESKGIIIDDKELIKIIDSFSDELWGWWRWECWYAFDDLLAYCVKHIKE